MKMKKGQIEKAANIYSGIAAEAMINTFYETLKMRYNEND